MLITGRRRFCPVRPFHSPKEVCLCDKLRNHHTTARLFATSSSKPLAVHPWTNGYCVDRSWSLSSAVIQGICESWFRHDMGLVLIKKKVCLDDRRKSRLVVFSILGRLENEPSRQEGHPSEAQCSHQSYAMWTVTLVQWLLGLGRCCAAKE